MSKENNDFRKKHILHAGDTITSGKTVYTITDDFVAYGGSAVVYSAVSSESSKENPIKFVIKEVFPNEGCFERKSGIIRSSNFQNAAELNWQREHIWNEQKLGGLCYNETNLAVPVRHIFHPDKITVDGKEYAEDIQEGVFAALDDISKKALSFCQMLEYIKQPKSEERPFGNSGSPTLHTTAYLIKKVLLTLRAIHNQGLLFGDIHMDNVWFAKDSLELGIIQTAYFMDFGCSRPLVDGEKTDIVKDRIYSSRGFIPPELVPGRWAKEGHTISIRADIFSVGCLMLRCLFPEEYWDHFGKSPVIGPYTIQHDDMKRLGIDNALRIKVNKILENAMHQDPKKRYPSANHMLVDIQSLIDHFRPPKNQLNLSFSTLGPGEFRGREEEIRDIDRRILEHHKPIELYGFGGMGKSELAIEYCRQKATSSGVNAHFVHFDKSIRNTILGPIADAFSGYSRTTEQGAPKSEQQIYSEVMKMLGEQSEDDILCIDNVDSETEEFADLCGKEYEDLCRLKMNIIITTRFDRKKFGGVEVGALQRKHLYGLMTHILKDSPVTLTEKQMDKLIQAVDAHTLLVELLAKTLRSSDSITAEYLVEKLSECDISSGGFAKVSTAKDRVFKKRRLDAHLRCLFQIADLPDAEFSTLQCAALAGHVGIDRALFARTHPTFDVDALNHLVERGWLFESAREYSYRDKISDQLSYAKERIIFTHPLIVTVVFDTSTKALNRNVITFFTNLWKVVTAPVATSSYDSAQIRQIRNCMNTICKYFSDVVPADVLSRTKTLNFVTEKRESVRETFWGPISGKEDSLDSLIDEVSAFSVQPSAMGVSMASIYHNAAVVYYLRFKSYKKAIVCEKRALDLTTSDESFLLRKEYTVLGKCHGFLKDYASAIDCYLMAYHYQCACTSEEHPDNSELLSELSMLYLATNNNIEAYRCLKKAMHVWEICLQNEYPNRLLDRFDGRAHVASLYYRLAQLAKDFEEFNEAHTYAAKAKIMETDNAEFPYCVYGVKAWCGIPISRVEKWKVQFKKLKEDM